MVDYDNYELDFNVVKEIVVEVIISQLDDVYVVEVQLQYVIKMWDSVMLCLKIRLDQINNVKEIVEEYQKVQRFVCVLYVWVEDVIVFVEVIGLNIE